MSVRPLENYPGFICIEGIDGSGKTTVAECVVRTLGARGCDAVFVSRTTIPRGGAAAERLRLLGDLLWNYPADLDLADFGDRHLVSLMASWYHLFDKCVVRPALREGRLVVTDQWIHKYLARFRVKGQGWVPALFDGLSEPDLAILLDLAPAIAAERKPGYRRTETNSGNVASHAGFVEFQGLVRAELASLVKPNWRVIDASPALPAVLAAVVEAIATAAARTRGIILRSEGAVPPEARF